MVTKIKPRRMNASSSWSLWKDLAYQTESVFDRWVGGGDMKYADFGFQDLTGSTVTLDLSTEVTPTGNFVVVAPSDIKDWQQYILRVNNWATVYTMGLAWNTSNPYNIPLSLTANATDQFVFLAVWWVLELQKNIDRVTSVWWWITWTLSNQTDLQNALDDKQDELTPSTWISIDSSNNISNTLPWPRISSTAPSNPTEGMEWYDTTNDVLKVYDWSNWKIVWDDAANINVKAFYLSDTSDLTTAQAAYDWIMSWKEAIISYLREAYILDSRSTTKVVFNPAYIDATTTTAYTQLGTSNLEFNISSWIVTSVWWWWYNLGSFLDIWTNYSTPYTPTSDWSPATKIYVDSNDTYIWTSAPSNPVEGRLRYDTANDQLKVYDGTNRNNVNTQVTVEDNLTSTSTTNALSANQWRILDWKIADLMALWKFLSLWNAVTGQPVSFPYTTPYAYTTWDYFLVEVVDPTTNYRPDWSSYTWTASSTAETDELEVWDVYIYDGSVWLLQSNHWKTVTFANIAWQPTDNTNLATALWNKQDTLSAWTWISISSNTVANTWVTSFNGSTWAVTYTAPVTSVNWNTWAVTTADVLTEADYALVNTPVPWKIYFIKES